MAEGRSGIDLGTAIPWSPMENGDKPVVIPGVDGSNLVPSVVALDPMPADGSRPTVTVGNSAPHSSGQAREASSIPSSASWGADSKKCRAN